MWCALSNLLCVFLRGPSILDLERMRCDGSRCSPKSLDIDVSASLPGLNVNVFVYVCICAGVLLAPSFVFVHVCFFIQLWNLNSTLNNPTLNVLNICVRDSGNIETCMSFSEMQDRFIVLEKQNSLVFLAVNHVKQKN